MAQCLQFSLVVSYECLFRQSEAGNRRPVCIMYRDTSRVVSLPFCSQGLAALRAEFPEVTIVTGAVDDCLDERRFILPGLGDFGDRL